MRFTKKIMSLLLTITMITTMMPAITFAVSSEPVEITSVEIRGLDKPIVGENPDFTASIPDGAPYHFASHEELQEYRYDEINKNYNGICWMGTSGNLKSDDLIEKGKEYKAHIILIPNEGYTFAKKVTGTINGELCYTDSYGTNLYLTTDDLDAVECITSVEIRDLEKPVVGEKPDFTASVPDGAPYHFASHEELKENHYNEIDTNYNGIWWYEYGNGYMNPNKLFEKGTSYRPQVSLIPNDGYIFAEEVTGKINGVLCHIMNNETDLLINGNNLDAAECITSVEIRDLENPVIGEKPKYSASVPDGAPYHFASREELENNDYDEPDKNYNGIWWLNEDEDKIITSDELFKKGKSYSVVMALIPNDGYVFAKDVVATINGKKCVINYCARKDLSIISEPMEAVELKGKVADVTLNKYFTKVNDDTYKYRTRGKHVNAKPIVKDEKGNILEENADYKVTYSDSKRTLPGKYTIKVEGIGGYLGTVEKTLIITPEAVEDINARLSTAEGGYDDAYVTWDKSEGADGYQVYARRPSKTEKWTYLGRTTKTSFLEKDLYDGWKYEFKVVPYEKEDEVRYKSADGYDIAKVTTLKKVSKPSAKKYSSSRVKISWKDIYGESGYQVMASRKGKTTYFRTSGTSIKLSVAKNKKYTYKVRAYKNVTKNGKTYRVYAPWSSARTYTLK